MFVSASLTFAAAASDPGDGLGGVSAELTRAPRAVSKQGLGKYDEAERAPDTRPDTLGR